ncbi:chemotaxis protein [Yersinia kristensenii]|uniref:chemotaxis protein n=1 Tax=Yersinia kristensenii TaxID=28152 RepID=UPI0030B9A115
MADKYKIDGVPPQNNVAGTEIPAYERAPLSAIKMYRLHSAAGMVYAISSELSSIINEEASEARIINVAAQGVGVPVEQFGNVSGAMRIRGVDNIEAIKSTQLLYQRLNDIAWGNNELASELLEKNNIEIVINENGTVNAPETMKNYSSAYSLLAQQDKSELDNAIEFDSNEMILPREGNRLGGLFSSVKSFGFNIESELNQRLTTFENEKIRFSAAKDGWLQKFKNDMVSPVVFDDILSNMTGGVTDLIAYDYDKTSFFKNWMMIDGYNLVKKNDAQSDPDFLEKLDWYERVMLNFPGVSGSVRRKMQQYADSKKSTSSGVNGAITGFNLPLFESEPDPEKYIINPETGNAWKNNRIADLNTPKEYPLWPSFSALPDSNPIGILPADNVTNNLIEISPYGSIVANPIGALPSDNIPNTPMGISPYGSIVTNPIGALPGDNIPNTPMGISPYGSIVTNPIGALPSDNIPNTPMGISPNGSIVAGPVMGSPIYAESANGDNFNANVIADVIATAMQNNRVQIELTLIDGRTGETSVLLGQGGGRITYAMAMPM